MFLMIKINKENHAESTGIHDFSTTPKTFPQQHATHILLSLQVKNVLLSRPFCKTPSALWHRNQQTLLSRHPFVKASFCQGILLPRAPFCQGSSGSCSQRQPWSTADAEGLDTSGTLCHKALEHLPQS